MYAQISEQFEETLKPASELLQINVKTVETLAQQQTSLFTSFMNDSLAFTQSMMGQKDVAGILNAQKEFGEEVQSKLVEGSKEVYATLTEAQDAAAEIFKGSVVKAQEKAQEAAAEVAPKAAPKKSK
jgi:phasin family protein